MRSSVAGAGLWLAALLLASAPALAQDKVEDATKVRVPLAIYTGEGMLDRGKSFERDRNSRCETRSDLTISLYDGGKIHYRNLGKIQTQIWAFAEGDVQPDSDSKNPGGKSFSMNRKGNNRTFEMVGQIRGDQSRVSGSWTVQVRLNSGTRAGQIANTCVYTFDLARVPKVKP